MDFLNELGINETKASDTVAQQSRAFDITNAQLHMMFSLENHADTAEVRRRLAWIMDTEAEVDGYFMFDFRLDGDIHEVSCGSFTMTVPSDDMNVLYLFFDYTLSAVRRFYRIFWRMYKAAERVTKHATIGYRTLTDDTDDSGRTIKNAHTIITKEQLAYAELYNICIQLAKDCGFERPNLERYISKEIGRAEWWEHNKKSLRQFKTNMSCSLTDRLFINNKWPLFNSFRVTDNRTVYVNPSTGNPDNVYSVACIYAESWRDLYLRSAIFEKLTRELYWLTHPMNEELSDDVKKTVNTYRHALSQYVCNFSSGRLLSIAGVLSRQPVLIEEGILNQLCEDFIIDFGEQFHNEILEHTEIDIDTVVMEIEAFVNDIDTSQFVSC